jgi:meiotically up-regulated gene 157 (Mug157) protein
MRAFTAQNDKELKTCVEMLVNTDANTGFMHESFHKDDEEEFTREWFAWQNSLFGELIVNLVENGKLDVLNSIKTPKYKKPAKRR